MGIFWSHSGIEPQFFPDTQGYLPDPRQLEGSFSLSGNALRGWPTVLIFWLAGNSNAAVAFQTLLYAISWSFLFLAFFYNKVSKYSIVPAVLLLVYSLSPRAIQWNQFLLSESISISLVISGLATIKVAITQIKKDHKKLFSIALICSSVLFSFASVNRFTLLPLGILPVIILFIVGRKVFQQKLFSLSMVLIFFGMILYPILYNLNTDKYWSDNGKKLSRSSFYFLYNTVEGSLQPEWGDNLWEFAIDRSPECLMWYRTESYNPGRNAYYLSGIMPEYCPQGAAWLNENYDAIYLKFILKHPADTLSYAWEMWNLIQDSTGNVYKSIIPKPLYTLFESPILEVRDSQDETNKLRPVYLWLALPIFSILILLTIGIKPNKDTVLLFLIFLSGLASISLTQFAIVSEPVRITTPATVFTITSAILVFNEVIQQVNSRVRNKQLK